MGLSGSRSALLYILGAHKALHVSQRTRPPAARSVSLWGHTTGSHAGISPQLQKTASPGITPPPRGGLWPMTGQGPILSLAVPAWDNSGSPSQLQSSRENQLQSLCRQASSAHLPSALPYSCISWEHCPRPSPLLHSTHHHRVISRELSLKHRAQGSNGLSPEDSKAAVNVAERKEKSCEDKRPLSSYLTPNGGNVLTVWL